MRKVRVVLADDHEVVQAGFKALIANQPGMDVIGEASDGVSAVETAVALKPDIVVMDVSMPGLSGIQATLQLKQQCTSIKVLALTMHEDKSYFRQLLEAGVSGYVLKRSAADELIRAIRTVVDGRVYVDSSLTGTVVAGFLGKPADMKMPAPVLSGREAQVVMLIAKGYSNKEIAAQLDVGVRTVEKYKGRCMEKLGFTSRTQLVRYALQHGWLQET